MKRKGFIAAALLALHVLVVGMAMSPSLHHLLHQDADSPDHQCAATLLIDGQLDQPDASSITPTLALVFIEPHRREFPLLALPFVDAAHGGRAPPVA